ncbi:MAG: aminodeoxychorismate/anthranilate synthase component II [Candidatus Saliniplasma sp.]
MQKILLIDNFDSFVYNLDQYLGELGSDVVVKRNHVSLKDVKDIGPDKIVIGPGPGRPEDAGVTLPIIDDLGFRIPILGICLGHQAIAYAYGGTIKRAKRLLHGKPSTIYHDNRALFSNLPTAFRGIRYHSLIVDPDSLPSQLEVLAETEEKEIMAIKHKKHPIYGLQFHPESVLNEYGKEILSSFLEVKA